MKSQVISLSKFEGAESIKVEQVESEMCDFSHLWLTSARLTKYPWQKELEERTNGKNIVELLLVAE